MSGRGYIWPEPGSQVRTVGDKFRGHVCNCIGCCERCGTCRTAPWHTPDYCALLVKQQGERAEFLQR